MDFLDKIAQSHTFMLESHKAFLELIEELKDEREMDSEPVSFSADLPDETPIEAELDETGLYVSEDSDEDDGIYNSNDAFPMTRKAFDYREIDMEDPSFWGGKEIGIPMGLLVHSEDGQGKLLPIKNGMFVDDGEI